MKNGNIHFVLMLLVFSFSMITVSKAENLTNLDVYKNLVHDDICKCLQQDRDTLFYQILAPESIQWLLEEQVNACALENGFDVRYGKNTVTDSLKSALLLDFNWISSHITYTSKSLLPEKSRLRRIELQYYLKLSGAENRIYHSQEYTRVFEDTVRVDDINKLENPNIPVTMGTQSNRFFKIFEPLLVIGVTGAIVYIFYAFRSN